MTGLRTSVAVVALCLVAWGSACDSRDEPETTGSARAPVDDAAPIALDLELVPAAGLVALVDALGSVLSASVPLCPEFAEGSRYALGELAAAARLASEGLTPTRAAAALEDLSSAAEDAAASLAVIELIPPRAARRHAELAAAVHDLASGFTSLEAALSAGDERAAKAASARAKNGLDNVALAADAVLLECR
jgi:hypothetical protein